MNQVPEFTTQMRGFDRDEVGEYIRHAHGRIGVLEQQLKKLEKIAADSAAERERFSARVSQLQDELKAKAAHAESEREQLLAQIARLQNDLERASGPVESVEGMSERIARMMRIASDEARRTKELAKQEAEVLTRELREQVQAASHDRIAAGEMLAELQVSTNARREKILSAAMADAEQILETAREERDRLAQETEEAERSRRDLYLRLAEEDEKKRREAQESLDEQIKLAWEEDVRNRQEARQRMEQQVNSAWQQAEKRITEFDEEVRRKATDVMTTAQREAALLTGRTEAEVARLRKERAEIVGGLDEIRRWIETTVSDVRSTEASQSAEPLQPAEPDDGGAEAAEQADQPE